MIGATAFQVMDFSVFYWIFGVFFFVVIVVIAIVAFKGMSSGGRVQRPVVTDTSFPPPPPPDTVMVKCEFCGTQQVWKETCVQCGAPLPKPKIGVAEDNL